MAKLLLFGKSFPLVLNFNGLIAPLLTDDLRDLWIRKPRMLSNDLGLVMLAVKDEC